MICELSDGGGEKALSLNRSQIILAYELVLPLEAIKSIWMSRHRGILSGRHCTNLNMQSRRKRKSVGTDKDIAAINLPDKGEKGGKTWSGNRR